MTGAANQASIRAVTMKTRSDSSSRKCRTRGGIMLTSTSMRIWRLAHETGPLPRKTQPTIRKSMISSAHEIETLKK